MPQPVTAIVLTRNSAETIARTLASLEWAAEVLVVDAESSDTTEAICKTSGLGDRLHFIRRPWPGFRAQRNFALTTARHDWVFSIDSDEACSHELATKIQFFFAQGGPPLKAYKVRRQEYFLGKPINYGVWNPSYQDRFFNKVGIQYINEVHEYPKFPSPPGRIEEPIHHWPDFSPTQFIDKMNRYVAIEARDRVRAGQRTHLVHLLGAGVAMFFKNYFYYRAYRDGMHGLVISLLEGMSRTLRHVRIWQYTKELKNRESGTLSL